MGIDEPSNIELNDVTTAVENPIETEEEKSAGAEPAENVELTGEQLKNATFWRKLIIKIGYGMGEGGLYTVSSVLGFFQQTFLLEVAQISATYAGIILLAGECFDAITDPFIGKMSDQTKTPLGRRRPWILFGAIPCCFLFWLCFLVPSFLPSEFYLVLYYLLTLIMLKFFYACVVSSIAYF